MARTLTASSGVEVIEEAIHLLRGEGLRSLLLAWTGAVPFAIGTLLFWRDMTYRRGGDVLCAFESLLLVALLLWMNVWRGIFADTLRSCLSGDEPRLSKGATLRSAGVQLLLGNLKLVVLPFAAVTVLPYPAAVAFFRIAVGIAAGENKNFLETVAKARKLTSSITQPVLLAMLLGFVGLLLFANILVALALAPKVVLALTGYESSFTRAGMRILADPSFYLVAVLITWLAIEPLTQAVYTVAAFHAESRETGEDVRVSFRALLGVAGSTAALLIILATSSPAAGRRVDPSELDRAIQQTITSPEYSWHIRPEKTNGSNPWFVRFTDSIAKSLRGVTQAIGRGISRFIAWLRSQFETPPPGRQGPPASGEIRLALYVASLLVLLGAGYLVWLGRSAFTRRDALPTQAPTINLAAEELIANQLPEEHWYLLAEECLKNGRFRLGLRALHLASLAWLGREQWIAIHPGKTDHEYESELARRGRAFPGACRQFSSNIGVFERVWYGDHQVSLEICQTFRNRTEEMKREMVNPGVSP